MKLGESEPKPVQKALKMAMSYFQRRANMAPSGVSYIAQGQIRGMLRSVGYAGLAEYVMYALAAAGMIEPLVEEMTFSARMWRLTPAGEVWKPEEGGAQ